VELHRGRVWVESQGIGHGTTFTVVLPLATTPMVAPPPPVQPSTEGPPDEPVLVIDDSNDTLDVLAVIINHAGWRVITAQSVAEALELLKTVRPCAIITDIGLPEVDGFSMMSNFRHALPANVPIVALSGFAEEENRNRATELGFADYITKPADLESVFGNESLATHDSFDEVPYHCVRSRYATHFRPVSEHEPGTRRFRAIGHEENNAYNRRCWIPSRDRPGSHTSDGFDYCHSGRRPLISWIQTATSASTSRMWMKPPSV